ncbi:MAG TPA: protein kinase [Steroidobacteraceae bacterium]
MSPERWEQVSKVFDELLVMDANARAARLDVVCRDDPQLRAEVSSLLSAHEQAQSRFLESPAIDQSAALHAELSRSGQKVGGYRLVREIGRGGMGEVYLATRADGEYTKEVAIKLVRSGPGAVLLLERFRNERQILASLDHPNIARLLDGGTTDDGVPFLAMELVTGVPIDQFCDRQPLDTPARLALFREVCAAVQYAHRHLVVHRDIKPGNILVTPDGTPKLLDFGIARILAPTGAGSPEAVTVLHAMTPEYASPEQIRGGPLSTSTDVYSLGVVLYRLLSGHSPYERQSENPHALAQAICNTDPPRPSQLRPRLHSDLDAIVLKAIRKEPEERYSLVAQLAEDVQRHLSGQPVTAAKGSWRYRAGKFIGRHRAGVAAALLVVVVVSAAIVAVVREAQVAQHEAAAANAQRALVQKRFDDVREFSNSLIFDVHDAIQKLPGATPVRQLLLNRAVQYLDAVAADAAGSPDLQRELGWAFQRLAVVQGNPAEANLGDEQASLRSDRKALALFEAVAKMRRGDVVDQLNVAMMHRILAYSTLTEPIGRADLGAAMAITAPLIAAHGDNPKVRSERSIEYQDLGLMHEAQGNFAAALDSFREYRRLRFSIRQTNPDYPLVVRSCGVSSSLVARALFHLGESRESVATLRAGIVDLESVSQHDPASARDLAVARQLLGDMLLSQGDLASAEQEYARAAGVLGPMAAADPQNALLRLDLASVEFQTGRLRVLRHRFKQAIGPLKEVAAVLEAGIPAGRDRDESPNSAAAAYIWLGDAYAGAGDGLAALESYRKSTAVASLIGSQNLDAALLSEVGAGFVRMGNTLLRRGEVAGAEAAYHKTLEILMPVAASQYRNVSALYAIAGAQTGLGDSSALLATRTRDRGERARLLSESRAAYETSRSAWAQIPEPAAISPAGFAVDDPRDLPGRLARVAVVLRRTQ